ncbi:unnamed protein product, partial [Allacma fusca]
THPKAVASEVALNQNDMNEKRVPWYLLMIPIGTMIVYAIWGYSIRRKTNQYGFYTLAAACIYSRWRHSQNNPECTKALEEGKNVSTDEEK